MLKYEWHFQNIDDFYLRILNAMLMKKIIVKNGLIGGLIVATMMAFSTILFMRSPANFEPSMIIGFSGMFLAFIFVFLGIKQFRDKVNAGQLHFTEGLKIGLWIALLTSTIYVVIWMVEYSVFFPNFADKYAEYIVKNAQPEELAEVTKSANEVKEIYKSQLMVFLYTYTEVLPIGMVFAIVSALILKRKTA